MLFGPRCGANGSLSITRSGYSRLPRQADEELDGHRLQRAVSAPLAGKDVANARERCVEIANNRSALADKLRVAGEETLAFQHSVGLEFIAKDFVSQAREVEPSPVRRAALDDKMRRMRPAARGPRPAR